MENSQRRIRILESMARTLYREWFVQFRIPGHEKANSTNCLPDGWEDKSLADLMDMRGGSQPEKSEFVYEEQPGYVRLIQIRDFESDSHLTFVRESPKLRLCKRRDIMIARYGASVARVCSGLTGAYNVALVKVVPLVPNCQEFLREFLSDDDFQKRLIGMSGRAAQNGFNKSDIASIRVPVPRDPTLFERFERFAVQNRNAIQNLHDKIQNLRRTRDLLLPRLLSGQVEV
jgi:type I restriction enzyme S subunit